DEPLVVEPHEGLADGADQVVVQREAQTRPVAGGAELLELADDGAARLLFPRPHAAHELLAAEVVLALALGGELALDHDLRGDAGVIGARLPERIEAVHPLHANEDVLQRHGEAVAHVQRAGDVGRRHHDAVGRPGGLGVGAEVAALLPLRIPALLDGGGLVAIRDRRARRRGRLPHALERVIVAPGSRPSDATRPPAGETSAPTAAGPRPPRPPRSRRPRPPRARRTPARCAAPPAGGRAARDRERARSASARRARPAPS